VAEFLGLSDAVAALVHDGDCVSLEGRGPLAAGAAVEEIIRQGRRRLRIARMGPGPMIDQMIGIGAVEQLIFSWAGAVSGSLHRFRDAVQTGWPASLELDEHSQAGLVHRYIAGASGLPFAVMRGYLGSDLLVESDQVKAIECPFTGEPLAAIAALRPDVTIIHAQHADRAGNVMFYGMVGVQKEAALAGRRVLVTVDEVVDQFEPRVGEVVLPAATITAIAVVPDGWRSAAESADWDAVSRDHDTFQLWMADNVYAAGQLV
jgi:glutaconate CoA-transferase subunit A